MRLRRRAILSAGAALSAGPLGLGTLGTLAGCSPGPRVTSVAVVWSDSELDLFNQVLRGYPYPVRAIGVGDDIDAFLRARHRAGTLPDVAILPRPGLVTEYAQRGWLSPLDNDVTGSFPPGWAELLQVDGKLYGAWVKATVKSLFWYRPDRLTAPPQTWSELSALVRELGAAGGPAPLAIGAADGWVLTDWLENLLAALAPPPAGLDDALVAGRRRWQDPTVREALTMLARLWSLPGAFVGGGGRALLTQLDEAVIQVTDGRATMVFEGDFVAGVVDTYADQRLSTFRFPRVNGIQPLMASGDAAVVLRGSTRGQDLVTWLIQPDAFRPWIDAGGYLSPNLAVLPVSYPDQLQRDLAADMQKPGAIISFDLSDRLPSGFTGADGMGIWRVLQDFFEAVCAPGADLDRVVDHTLRELDRGARETGGV